MKTILTRCKTLVLDNNRVGETLEYVRAAEIVHPDLELSLTTISSIPKIIFHPISTTERWVATGRKEAVHLVMASLILEYRQRESSIIGDATRPSGQGKGIVDFVVDFLSVFRGHRLSTGGSIYLDKPMDIENVDYVAYQLTEEAQLLVAQITLNCSRLFDQATLPGNI